MTETKPQEKIFADTGNRAAAWLLDVFLLVSVTAAAGQLLPSYAFPLLAVLYFSGMPLSPLQGTLGKWICRIKLCDRHGGRLTWRVSLARMGAQVCWFAIPPLLGRIPSLGDVDGATLAGNWWLLFALPWAPVWFMPRRESAFDLLAGSLVVRCKADVESIAGAAPVRKPGILNVGGTVVFSLAIGALFSIVIVNYQTRSLHARVAYAVDQTLPVREKIREFHEAERRWPTAAELGLQAWTPYPDGGGYRVQKDGTILITFSVLPELKGRNIAFRPMRTDEGLRWQCSADVRLNSAYLPSSCRLDR